MADELAFGASFPTKCVARPCSSSFAVGDSLLTMRTASSRRQFQPPAPRVPSTCRCQMADPADATPAGCTGSGEVAPNNKDVNALVRELWACFDTGVFTSAASLFHPDAVYHDTLYPAPFVGVDAIRDHFKNMERVFGTGDASQRLFRFVVDDIAAGDCSAGARWHLELSENGQPVPFSRGASTYKIVPDPNEPNGRPLFMEAWDFPEPTLKLAPLSLFILGLAAKLLRTFPRLTRSISTRDREQ